jgi:hypothetical protein
MTAHDRQKAFEREAIEQILAGMQFVTEIDPGRIESVEDRQPAPARTIRRSTSPSAHSAPPATMTIQLYRRKP